MRCLRIMARLAPVLAALLLAACNDSSETFQGWIEGDFVFVGPDEMGRVETLSVREGDRVTVGMPLFTVDSDLQKADVLSGEAALANAQQTFRRADELLKNHTGTQKDFDTAQAALRDAEAKLNWSKTRLARRAVASPANGSIQQVYYRPGEMVSAGRPVVSFLPPGNIKVRFYVPEAMLPKISAGQPVKVSCDGCAPDIVARVTFISGTNEYTPPVIYSLDERSKLVYLIEALPERPDGLRVGQPVSVVVSPNAPKEAKK
ncbi:MAG TPA: efflux RND transporter periplasmic adaptor subunit [Xanthobacteraceae bacterium]|nr:efflux RND transporter periplasmic adaptor subunit [Xanthobacteraceae bacterium]